MLLHCGNLAWPEMCSNIHEDAGIRAEVSMAVTVDPQSARGPRRSEMKGESVLRRGHAEGF